MTRRLTVAAGAIAALAALGTPAQAQTRTIGNTDPAISQALVGFGFAPQFRIIDRELVRTVVEACRGRDMFRVSVNVLGAVKTKEPRGRCDIRGVAANEPRRERETAALSPREVRDRLQRAGYSRIEFTDRELPRYVAEACDASGDRVRLRINRNGDVRRSERVRGNCQPERRSITVADVRKGLSDEGYDRIRFETDAAPFRVLACRERRQERLVINRRGRVVERDRAGRCGPRATTETLTKALRERGFDRVRVEREDRGFKAIVCEGSKRFQIFFNGVGERTRRNANGECIMRGAGEILDQLRERGARKVQLFVEGCFRGDRYRWAFDELGDRTGRRKIGSC